MERKKLANLVASLLLGTVSDTTYHFSSPATGISTPEIHFYNASEFTTLEVKQRHAEKIKNNILNHETFDLEITFHIRGIDEPVISVISYEKGKKIENKESAFDVTFHESFV